MGGGRRKKSCYLMGRQFQFCKSKRILEMFHSNGNILNTTELYT